MSALFKQIRLYIPVIIIAGIFMLSGHFCLASKNITASHSHIQQSHHSMSFEDNFKVCCQQSHDENLNNRAVIEKNNLAISNNFTVISNQPYTTTFIPSVQSNSDPDISPHKFKDSLFRILLC